MAKTCFVVMRIGEKGTPEFTHFRAVFDQIRAALGPEGYTVIRSDDIEKPGAITKDVVLQLAQADLVVADLTELNPNVFYELGVRHALRARGTVMLLDQGRTDRIPFDLAAYKVIKYVGDLSGISELTAQLRSFADALVSDDAQFHLDNPVHDWLPGLPADLLYANSDTEAADLRREVSDLRNRIERYRQTFGDEFDRPMRSEDSPLERLRRIRELVDVGNSPPQIVERFNQVVAKTIETPGGAIEDLVLLICEIVENRIRLSTKQLSGMVTHARSVGLEDLARVVLEYGIDIYPQDKTLQRSYLAHLAHSSDPADTAQAKAELAREVNFAIDSAQFGPSEQTVSERLMLYGYLLDVVRRDGDYATGLRYSEAAYDEFGETDATLRNLGRALIDVGREAEGLERYRTSLSRPDGSETAAVWLGNFLHNEGQHVDAIEAYLLGAWADATDASNFSNVAEELSFIVGDPFALGMGKPARSLPAGADPHLLLYRYCCAAFACNPSAEDQEGLRRTMERAEVPGIGIEDVRALGSRTRRRALIWELYDLVASDLTANAGRHLKPVPDGVLAPQPT